MLGGLLGGAPENMGDWLNGEDDGSGILFQRRNKKTSGIQIKAKGSKETILGTSGNDRLDSRNADLQRAYESASTALEKAKSSNIPEVMKYFNTHRKVTITRAVSVRFALVMIVSQFKFEPCF